MNIDTLLLNLRNDHKLSENEINHSIEILIRSIISEDIKKKSITFERDYNISESATYDLYLIDSYENYPPQLL